MKKTSVFLDTLIDQAILKLKKNTKFSKNDIINIILRETFIDQKVSEYLERYRNKYGRDYLLNIGEQINIYKQKNNHR
jgi:translation initiation factor 2 beta subunit (eIF-2beta)/eIF-5